MSKSMRMTPSAHIELSKTGALAHTWDCPGMGRAFGFAFLLPLILDGVARYQFLNFIPIRLIVISFYRRLPTGAAAAIS
jgi:hypothetical protein